MEKINFKKKFGQNFLTDKNLLASIVKDAGITNEDVVLEIGAGAGALTEQIALVCKKLVSFEIDTELQELLNNKFETFENVNIIYEDFLNFDDNKINELSGKNFKVVANLPYYITTPILTKLFNLKHRPKTISVMVQKEVGERIIANNNDSSYGYFSVFVQANADAKIVRQVNRKMFTPIPNVDSVIVRLDLKENRYPNEFFNFLKQAFQMKRKTLVNNLSSYNISKQEMAERLTRLGFSSGVRADSLSIDELYSIYETICK